MLFDNEWWEWVYNKFGKPICITDFNQDFQNVFTLLSVLKSFRWTNAKDLA